MLASRLGALEEMGPEQGVPRKSDPLRAGQASAFTSEVRLDERGGVLSRRHLKWVSVRTAPAAELC